MKLTVTASRQPPDLRSVLDAIEWRIEETLQAYEVQVTLNQRCVPENSKALHEAVNACAGFWHPVGIGLQMSLILGIFAVLDGKRKDSATLFVGERMLSDAQRQLLPLDFVSNLKIIEDRYARYRHKLFAHSDHTRADVAYKLEQEGFTWESVASDIRSLRGALRILQHVTVGRHLPSEDSNSGIIGSPELAAVRARRDTNLMLDQLLCGAWVGAGPLRE